MSEEPRYITETKGEYIFVCGHLDSRDDVDDSDGCCEFNSDEWQCVHDYLEGCESVDDPRAVGLHTQMHGLLPYEIDAMRFTDWVESEVYDRFGEERHKKFEGLIEKRFTEKGATEDLARKLTEVFSEWLQTPGKPFQWVYDSEACSMPEPVDEEWIEEIVAVNRYDGEDEDEDTCEFASTLIGASHD